jgi:hypothetical protein
MSKNPSTISFSLSPVLFLETSLRIRAMVSNAYRHTYLWLSGAPGPIMMSSLAQKKMSASPRKYFLTGIVIPAFSIFLEPWITFDDIPSISD